MRISAMLAAFLATLLLPPLAAPQTQTPMIRSVEPDSGKAGDLLGIKGENLGQNNVAALYLTDGVTDVKVTIVEQTPTSMKFKIPPEAKPGRFALMVLTNEKTPKLIEQPVKITVDAETTGSPGAYARGATI